MSAASRERKLPDMPSATARISGELTLPARPRETLSCRKNADSSTSAIEPNTVYREVPSTWSPTGCSKAGSLRTTCCGAPAREWMRVGDMVDLPVYIPEAGRRPGGREQGRAAEPVETGFTWRKRTEAEDNEAI